MSTLLQDLKFSLRLLAKTPGFSTATVALLALGIALNTAMFTFIYGVALSPRPFHEPDRLVQLYTQDRKNPESYRLFSHPLWQELSARADLFAGAMAFNHTLVGEQQGSETRRAFASLVSANYFDTLGVTLARGRSFSAAEARPNADLPVMIVSHAYWRKNGFADDILGRRLRINERAYTIVGVAPEGFSGTTMIAGPEFYFPLGVYSSLENFQLGEARHALEQPDAYQLFVVARLAPGIEPAGASAALDALGANLERNFPVEFKDQTLKAAPLPRLGTNVAPRSETAIVVFCAVLMGLAGSVLLIVCLNLAGLLLARGQSRRKEFAVRLALGGTRTQLIRQLCLEGLVLALVGGALGTVAAHVSLDLIVASLEARLPLTITTASPGSAAVLAATAGICLAATLVFSLGPALRLSRADVLTDLKQQAGDDASGPRRAWWRPKHFLVIAQVALSLALLVIAGLFLRTAAGMTRAPHGFQADHTVLAEIDATLGGLDETRSLELFRRAQDRLAALPGVSSASIASIVPYGMFGTGRSVRRDGPDLPPDARPATPADGRAFDATWNSVGAGYFTTLNLPLKQGRAFTATEASHPGGPRVVILDEVLARQLWPDGDALGQFVRFTGERDAATGPLQVVGIAAPMITDYFSDTVGGSVYVPFAQGFSANAHFHVRLAADTPAAAHALVPLVRTALQEAAPGVPIFKVRTFKQHAETSMEVWALSLSSALVGTFSGFAMFVAVLGIYSVKAYQVSRRTREIGIRMALGALPRAVQSLILREGLATASCGIAAGLLLGVGANRALAAVMYGVKPFDPLVLFTAATAFLLAATLACWLPARRATRVNPTIALRSE